MNVRRSSPERSNDQNPFSSRFVRPGAIAYRFSDSGGVEQLLRRLESQRWWGQIIGPHGSGKSTLLQTLISAIEQTGRKVLFGQLNSNMRQLPIQIGPALPGQLTQIVVDGYEQLSWWQRWRLKRRCQRWDAGLVITAHRDMGLPQLYATQVEMERSEAIVRRLLDGFPGQLSHEIVQRTLARHPHNLREALWELYDQYEALR